MTQYRPYEEPKKLEYIKQETIALDNNIENLKKVPDYQALPAKEFYKNAKLIYNSGWVATEHELIPEATSTETGDLLPARSLYNFAVPLSVSDEFLPYLKVEVLARTNPDILIEGVYSFHRTAYKPIKFALYQWKGVTYTTGCQAFGDPIRICPSPQDMYVIGESPGGCYFIYPAIDFPVPIGENQRFELPRKDLLGHENALYACPQSPPPPGQYWEGGGENEFMVLVQKFGYEGAKDLVNQYFDDIVYSEESIPYVAFEIIEEERVVTGHQVKKFVSEGTNKFTLYVDGSFLQISESVDETAYAHEEFPTYQPAPQDMEVKLNVYTINPNVYSERKYYTNGS